MTTATAPAVNCHTPGEPYLLSRQEFLTFLGQAEYYKELVGIFGRNHPYRQEQKAFWAVLAAFEAGRQFNPLAGCCGSGLRMETHGDEPGCMTWAYRTTSGTLMECSEPREHETQDAPGYPGIECSDELRPGYFRVTIPADRDQAGRYHHEQLKNGGAYCE
jgi:hypothetical protein